MLTLVASALAGGDCIDDADALRTGGTACAIGCTVKAPSTLGTFLRSFRWGHARQLDRVSREALARAWAAGAGPGNDPLTIDLDSTICETYGLTKEGTRRHNYAGQRGYHPLLAVAAGTGDVLMARLRKGSANTARGAAHFLRETVSRVRYAGATGPLTVRADSGFYTHDIVAVCRKTEVRFSITVRQHARLHNLIEAIPEADWTPIPYWMEGAADVAETEYTPFSSEPDAALVRLIVRRVKPTPGSQLALSTNYSYHAFIIDRDGDTLDLEADPDSRAIGPRRDRERHPRSQVRRGAQPPALGTLSRQRRLAGHSSAGSQPGPLDHAHRAGRTGVHHQDPATTLLLPGRTHHPQGTLLDPASSPGLALAKPVQLRPGATARPAPAFLTAPTASARPPNYPTASRTCVRLVSACLWSQRVRLSRPSPSPQQVTNPFTTPTHSAPAPYVGSQRPAACRPLS